MKAGRFALQSIIPHGREILIAAKVRWYRDVLRALLNNDHCRLACFYALYGMEKEAREIAWRFRMRSFFLLYLPPSDPQWAEITAAGILEQLNRGELRWKRRQLPRGKVVIDPTSGRIDLQFGCEFQKTVAELMKHRSWIKKCKLCARYFIANKGARIYCGTACSGMVKRKGDNSYWDRRGRDKRRERGQIQRAKE
jgi:hypothetical protein